MTIAGYQVRIYLWAKPLIQSSFHKSTDYSRSARKQSCSSSQRKMSSQVIAQLSSTISRGVPLARNLGPRTVVCSSKLVPAGLNLNLRSRTSQITKLRQVTTSTANMADPRTSEKDTPMQVEQQPWPGQVRHVLLTALVVEELTRVGLGAEPHQLSVQLLT
jgi:hypothetical protein